MNKIYVYIVLVLAIIGFIKWGHTQVYNQGYNDHKAEVADAGVEADIEDKKDVKEIIKWRTKEKKIYVDKIKYIDSVKDTTGCADVKLTDMGFGLQ